MWSIFLKKTASTEFCCRCGKTVKPDTSHGYVNLVNHLSRCTPDYEQQMSRSNSRLPFTSSVSKKAKNIYSYLDWIYTDGLPFNFVDEGDFGTLKCVSFMLAVLFQHYVGCIKPTSNIAERFFSKVRNVYTDNRKRLLPMNIESQMFLQANRQLWTPEDVQQFL